MKYIMFQDFSGDPVPIIFPNRVDFAEMREQVPYTKALSAGYVQLRKSGFTCHGESKTLGLKALPEDAAVIQAKFTNPET